MPKAHSYYSSTVPSASRGRWFDLSVVHSEEAAACRKIVKDREKARRGQDFFAAALELLDGMLHLGVLNADTELGTIPDAYSHLQGKGAERWRRRTC